MFKKVDGHRYYKNGYECDRCKIDLPDRFPRVKNSPYSWIENLKKYAENNKEGIIDGDIFWPAITENGVMRPMTVQEIIDFEIPNENNRN